MRPTPTQAPKRTGIGTGALLMTFATYLTYGVGIITNAVIARGLSPSDFGRYAYVIYISGVLVIISNNGLTTSGIRFVSEMLGGESLSGAQRIHGYLRRLSDLSQLLVLAVFVAIVLLVRPIDWQTQFALFVGVVVISAAAKARYLFDTSIAKGYGLFKVEAYSTVTIGSLTTLGAVLLYALHAPLSGYLLLFAASSLGFLLAAMLQLRRAGVATTAGRPEPEVLARLLPHLRWTMLLTGVAIFGNKSIEVFLLNATHGATDVGFFAIGAALTRGGIDLLTSGMATVLMPAMSNAFGRGGQPQVNKIYLDAVRYLVFIGLLAAGAGYFLALPTVQLLYGPSYQRAAVAFQVMVVVSGLTLGEGALGALLSTTDRQRSRALLVAVQIGVTVVLALLLVPAYGFPGALLSHALSRLLGVGTAFVWVNRMHGIMPPSRQLLRLLCAALPATALSAGAAVLIGHGAAGQLIAAAVYVAVLIPMSIYTHSWTRADLALAERLLERLGPRASKLRRWTGGLALRYCD
jgi:O-antigen/teichoic acid export membrane protein